MRSRRSAFAAILTIAAIPRIWAVFFDQGIFWPDEIFQSTEPAHTFAFGYGYVAWEFQDGARSWLFPGAIGLWWKLLTAIGVTTAPTLVVSVKLGMAALGLLGIYASMRIAEKLAGLEAAVLAGLLGAAFPPSIVYGSRAMTEMASAPLIALAVLFAMDRERSKLVAAGCLAGLAIFLRVQNGLVAVALLGWLLAQRRPRDAAYYAIGATAAGLAGGALDWITWGAPFHSFLTNVQYNLVEGRAAGYGVAPLWYYAAVFATAVGFSWVAILIGLASAARRTVGLLIVVLLFAAVHSAIPHKEFRFLMPIVPVMLALTGVGLSSIGKRGRSSPGVRPAAVVIAGVLAAAMGWRAANATFDDFGQYEGPLSGPYPVWHSAEAVNRLLWVAGQRPDLCGLGLVDYEPPWTGGYTYFHRDAPIIWMPGVDRAPANYVLVHVDVPLHSDYTTVETIGNARLARRPGSCSPPPPSYTRLFGK